MRKKILSKAVLDLFVKSQAVGELFLEFTYHPYRYIYKDLVADGKYKENSVRTTLRRLEKKGLLKRRMKGEEDVILYLTEKGKTNLVKNRLMQKGLPQLRSGYVFVIFDIPEGSRTIRDTLRRNLKEFGFKQMQKSVWSTKLDVFELVKDYFTSAGLLDYVVVLEANKSST